MKLLATNYSLQTTHYKLQTNKGFTLIEIILYIALAGIIVLVVSDFVFIVSQSRAKSRAIAEVEQQAAQAIQIITQTIRNAENVNSPAQGTSAASLSLDVVEAAKDPTIFDLSGGAIRIKEGVAAAVPLTSSRVTASNLNFYNLTKTGTPGTVRVSFTLSSYSTPTGKGEFDYSKTFYAGASLRQ